MMNFITVGELIECCECSNQVLVERAINGVSHTMATFATCWTCLSDEAKEKAQSLYGISADS